MAHSLGEIAAHLGASLHGDSDCAITGIATLETASAGDLTFLSNRRYKKQLSLTRAAAVILSEAHLSECPVAALIVDDVYLAFALAVRFLFPPEAITPGFHPSASVALTATIDASSQVDAHAVIKDGAQVGAGVYIGAGSVIGKNVIIGDNTRILENVVIAHDVCIGKNALFHPGVVIGADGFGFAENKDGSWVKIPQIGSVIVEDDVEVGANTTIDRGALGNTHIGKGVKIDNQVQIGHNVIIGEFTAIAGCAGVAGSARIGRRCRIGGGCGINGHIEIADDVILTGMSAVTNSIREAGVYSATMPATDGRAWRRNVARFHLLDESFREIRGEIKQLKDE